MNIIEALKVVETPQRKAFYEAADYYFALLKALLEGDPSMSEDEVVEARTKALETYRSMVESERGESDLKPNTTTEAGGWIKAVFMQEGDLPTVADCCRLAAMVEHGVVMKYHLAAETAAIQKLRDSMSLSLSIGYFGGSPPASGSERIGPQAVVRFEYWLAALDEILGRWK